MRLIRLTDRNFIASTISPVLQLKLAIKPDILTFLRCVWTHKNSLIYPTWESCRIHWRRRSRYTTVSARTWSSKIILEYFPVSTPFLCMQWYFRFPRGLWTNCNGPFSIFGMQFLQIWNWCFVHALLSHFSFKQGFERDLVSDLRKY